MASASRIYNMPSVIADRGELRLIEVNRAIDKQEAEHQDFLRSLDNARHTRMKTS